MNININNDMFLLDNQIIKNIKMKQIIYLTAALIVIGIMIMLGLGYKIFYSSKSLGNSPITFLTYKINNNFANPPKLFQYNKKYLIDTINQYKCGSCYIISSCNMLSDRLSLATHGNLKYKLSYQYLLCNDSGDTNDPCTGGNPEDILKYIEKNGAILEKYMPYKQYDKKIDDMKCVLNNSEALNSSKKIFIEPNTIKELCSSYFIKNSSRHLQNIKNMKMDLINNGPIIGTLYIHDDIFNYKSGQIYTKKEGAKFLYGHAVEIIGYYDSPETNKSYWIVHNSWSSKFGDNGYLFVKMYNNECEIESRSSSAIPMISNSFINNLGGEKVSGSEPIYIYK
jgi:C1A family cysteine protease